MNLSETARALALVQAFDQRTVGDADVIAWQSLLPDAALADVEAAVRQHYAAETVRIMPAHVLRAVAEIEKTRQVSPWAPGQHGVPREEAAPEVTTGGRMALSDLPAAVAELVARVRADLPEGSREALKPRAVAWEREHAAYQRSQDGEPNPHYKPRSDRDAECPSPIGGKCLHPMDDPAHNPRYLDPDSGSNNVETGILPDAHRCSDCTFVSVSPNVMDDHLVAYGHVHE